MDGIFKDIDTSNKGFISLDEYKTIVNKSIPSKIIIYSTLS